MFAGGHGGCGVGGDGVAGHHHHEPEQRQLQRADRCGPGLLRRLRAHPQHPVLAAYKHPVALNVAAFCTAGPIHVRGHQRLRVGAGRLQRPGWHPDLHSDGGGVPGGDGAADGGAGAGARRGAGLLQRALPALSCLAFCTQVCSGCGLSGLRVLCLGAHGLRRIVRRPGHVLHLRARQLNHHRPCCCLPRLPRLRGLLTTFLPRVGLPKLNLLTVVLGGRTARRRAASWERRTAHTPAAMRADKPRRQRRGGRTLSVCPAGQEMQPQNRFYKAVLLDPLGFCTCVSVLLVTSPVDPWLAPVLHTF